MTVNINNIYRVVCTDNYQRTEPETHWTTSKEACEKYIANSYYKHCLSIETAILTNNIIKK